MTELLPVEQAYSLRTSLLEYLATTFNLVEADTQDAFADFLGDPEHGMFRGPYVRLRLPFAPAAEGWQSSLDALPALSPYGHQARAFARLSTRVNDRPLPTVVTTGTGSGKTEAFTVPILDHVVRAKSRGTKGIKALILYPMNALANDQASRLAKGLTSNSAYAGITAALYTGEASDGGIRTRVSPAGLITDRSTIRDTPPDILLTNYKMLDQLLLRAADARLWRDSATSLTYLVIDEFHSYDGAQGTDVAMLLRRLGATLKSHWDADDPSLTNEDWNRPLGKLTPVATSATLGDDGDPTAMQAFAQTVTGEEIPAEGVITETRLTYAQWARNAPTEVGEHGLQPERVDRQLIRDLMEELFEHFTDPKDPAENLTISADPHTAARLVFSYLYAPAGSEIGERADLGRYSAEDLLLLAKAHPLIEELTTRVSKAVNLRSLAAELFPDQRRRPDRKNSPAAFLRVLFNVLSHLRAVCGRDALSVDLHLWVRELSRIDRSLGDTTTPFRWGDDGVLTAPSDSSTYAFPALYCRHCGRSGWGVTLAPTGNALESSDKTIRGDHLAGNERFRALLHAPAEVMSEETKRPENLRWFDAPERHVTIQRPDESHIEDGSAVPVITHTGQDAGKLSQADVCPSCEAPDAIRFLGSAIATQLSVALGTMFGTPHMDDAEKKALVFTDSVQDASHRAGFVAARSHTLTLRSVMRDHISDDPIDLESLVRAMITGAGDDALRRYRLLPPTLAGRKRFAAFWQRPTSRDIRGRKRVERRLSFDVALEFGLRSGVGRTLEATASAALGPLATDAQLLTAARHSYDTVIETSGELPLVPPGEDELLRWAHGVLLRMRQRGAIDHPWFNSFRNHDGNRWFLTGGRAREEGMPWFGPRSSAPGFPYLGGAGSHEDFDPVASRRGWYTAWTSKTLGVPTDVATTLSKTFFGQLNHRELIGVHTSKTGTTTYHLDPSDILVHHATAEQAWQRQLALACDTCGAITRGTAGVISALVNGPCLVHRCAGRLSPLRQRSNYYQRLYATPDPRRIVAREHTSMLPTSERLDYEDQFKATHPAPDAPNVLVATPTLEMGIDIGDLSAVMLSSMPRSVASYLQRVGRAGRLTGNSFAVAFVTARGVELPAFNRPETIINGPVRPPATYLDAEEILRRQYLAFSADLLARQDAGTHQHIRTAAHVLSTTEAGSFLGDLIEVSERAETMSSFLANFPRLRREVTVRLRQWATPHARPGDSILAQRCHDASNSWNAQIEQYSHRIDDIDAALEDLTQRATGPGANDDDKRALRTAQAAKRQAGALRRKEQTQPWIGALEAMGLLPNYTLIDDSVTLDVSLSWIDPDNEEFREDPFTLERGSEHALRDFAPGATFYSRGYAIEVDAIDLGRSQNQVHTWTCCPACGYVQEEGPAPRRCPRCDKPEIADAAQQIDVVELTHVSSIMRRERAAIDDRRDNRQQTQFTITALADINPTTATSWFVEGTSFGARYQRDTTIRWLNLGNQHRGGTTRTLAGTSQSAPLFRICPACGKLDSASGRNEPRDHRPWCKHRRDTAEPSKPIALTRSLQTEALAMRLPVEETVGDHFAVPSVRAALLLGLERRLGGSPDHLDITAITDPMPSGAENPDALLIYDKVPGGTGYLAELAEPEAMWRLIRLAWQALTECPCSAEDDPRLACEDCLLPYTPPRHSDTTSRAAAERILHRLLVSSDARAGSETETIPEKATWRTTSIEPEAPDKESYLEQHLRKALRERLDALSATISEEPTHRGVIWHITMAGGRRWRLDPQQDLYGSRPDFVLSSAESGIPPMAIFADGWRYHASPSINRLADDAEKRHILRDAGYYVLSLTAQDLEGEHARAHWFDPELRDGIMEHANLSPQAVDRLTKSSFESLVDWIAAPDPEARAQVAAWLPLMLMAAGEQESVPTDTDPAELAQTALTEGTAAAFAHLAEHDQQSGFASIYVDHTLAVATQPTNEDGSRSRIAVVIDDTEVGLDYVEHWRSWLHLSNLLALRDDPTVVTVTSAATATPRADVQPVVDQQISVEWIAAREEATEGERAQLDALLELDPNLPAPVLGEEIGDGVPLGLAWMEAKVAVDDGELRDDERRGLEDLGWRIVTADPETICAAVQDAIAARKE